MLEGHISKAFDGDLAALHIRTLEMGGLVLDQVREAARAYTEWDSDAAERVIDRVPSVSEYDTNIGRDELTLIARRQPVSRDLRAIFALAKCAAELESAGNEARKIARTVLRETGRPARATSADVRHLANLAIGLLRGSLEALDRVDAGAAAEVIASDEELDAEYQAGLRRLITRAMESPQHLDVAMEAAFVLKSLERIGDHARILADHVRDIGPEEAPHAPESADQTLKTPHGP
jgi:phosphate transport system protein